MQISPQQLKRDFLSGLTVALALVPEAVAFAFVAGVEPMIGLYAAVIMGFMAAVFGGRPGMISGATGATAVVMVAIVAQYGVSYLFAAVLLAGLLQILAGIFKLGKFIRLVPKPAMIGFVNGLAIVIFLSQLEFFHVSNALGEMNWMHGTQLYIMLGLVALTMGIIYFLPKLTKAVPSSLVALVVVTALVKILNLDTQNVLDFVHNMSGDPTLTLSASLPEFSFPAVPFTFETLTIILPVAVILAAIGLMESLLTLSLIDEITNTRGNGNRECIGQGMGNMVSGMFGAMGGCAMIGQSMINISSGGRSRFSGIFAAVALLLLVLFAAPLIEMIPLAALVGVMFMVVIGTFEWTSFRLIKKVPKADFMLIVAVTVITVFANLAIAVFIGIIASALMFAWKHARNINTTSYVDESGVKYYRVQGVLFFASTANFLDVFDAQSDPQEVVIDFAQARISDHTAIDTIETLADRYINAGKQLHFRHLSPDCRALLHKAGKLVEINVQEDPTYKVVTDVLG